jgi:hypothetical protein
MDIEFSKYQKLVISYPTLILVEPGLKSLDNYTYYDILTTRYLYMKTFNSVPPENIWKLKYGLNPRKLIIEQNTNKLIDIIIGYSDKDQLTIKIKKIIDNNLTINEVFNSIKLESITDTDAKSISSCICIGQNGLISPYTRIKELEFTQFIILVNF